MSALVAGSQAAQAETSDPLEDAKRALAEGDIKRAVDGFQKLTAVKRHAAEANFYLGRAYQEGGDLDKAIRSFQESIRLEPESAAAWGELGLTLQQKGRFDEAVNATRRSLALRDDPRGWYALGSAYHEKGEPDRAIEYCTKSSKLAKSH